jgi:hypothetical protein
LERVEFRGGKHDIEIETVVGHDDVIPDYFSEWIRNVLRGLEGETLGALSAIERGGFDKLSEREVTGHDEGAGAGKMFASRNRRQRLREMLRPAGFVRRIGVLGLVSEVLQAQTTRRPGDEYAGGNVTRSWVYS